MPDNPPPRFFGLFGKAKDEFISSPVRTTGSAITILGFAVAVMTFLVSWFYSIQDSLRTFVFFCLYLLFVNFYSFASKRIFGKRGEKIQRFNHLALGVVFISLATHNLPALSNQERTRAFVEFAESHPELNLVEYAQTLKPSWRTYASGLLLLMSGTFQLLIFTLKQSALAHRVVPIVSQPSTAEQPDNSSTAGAPENI